MPQQVTEIAFVPMVPEADLTDPENFAYKIVKFCGEITKRQPGFERGVWGVLKQQPQIWVTVTDWDDIASHEKFTKTAEHDQELEELTKINNQPLEVFHMNMDYASGTDADSKIRSPFIDVVTGYFPVDTAKSIIDVVAQLKHSTDGVDGIKVSPDHYAEGWAIEDDGPVWGVDGVQGGRTGKPIEKPWCGVFGWANAAADTEQEQIRYVQQKTSWIEAMGGERVMGRVVFADY